jgi:hypothetical protein
VAIDEKTVEQMHKRDVNQSRIAEAIRNAKRKEARLRLLKERHENYLAEQKVALDGEDSEVDEL